MANYSPNYNLYLPSRNDSDVEVDTSLTTNFTNIDNGLANHDAQLADIATPRPVIWLTDFASDVDDVGAGRVILWAERLGMVDLLAVCVNCNTPTIAAGLDAFLTAEGRPNVDVGWDANGINDTSKYHTVLMNNWRYSYSNGGKTVESDVSILRRALVNATHPVDIISTGYLNNLKNLLQSGADSISPLTGIQLVQQKVGTLWQMGGQYPSGSEWNFKSGSLSTGSVSSYVVQNWPNPIVFCGFEVGNLITSGDTLGSFWGTGTIDAMYAAYNAWGASSGRLSWDPITAYLGCIGDPSLAGFRVIQGTNTVDASTGSNTFVPSNTGNHKYVVMAQSATWYQHQLNTIYEKRSWSARKLGNQQLPKLSLISNAADTSHLVAWWNADDLSGIASGTQINFFEDRTRNNHLRSWANELPIYTTISNKSAVQFGIPSSATAWTASTSYSVGQIVYPSTPNGYFYVCKTAGTSGTNAPTWPQTLGSSFTDGTVTWYGTTSRLSTDNVDMSTNTTIYAKVLFSTLPTSIQTLLAQDSNAGSSRNWQLNVNASDQAQVSMFNGSTPTSDNNSTTITANTWVVLTAVITPTTITSYVNGISDGSTTVSNPNTLTMPISMGAIGYDGGSGAFGQFFSGYIHEALIYSAAHDTTTIQTVINKMT